MHPAKVRRDRLQALTDLPNVGPAFAADLRLLGIDSPQQLAGKDAYSLYRQLCDITQLRQDPCVLDTLMSMTDFIAGNPARTWWQYTAERKQKWPSL